MGVQVDTSLKFQSSLMCKFVGQRGKEDAENVNLALLLFL